MDKHLKKSEFCRTAILSALLPLAFAIPSNASDPANEETISGEDKQMVEVIDRAISSLWKQHNLQPAKPSGDSEFLRRIWLDLAGVIPPPAKVRRFLADSSSGKRNLEIDRLLQSPKHAAHMANVWQQILLPDGIENDRNNTAGQLREWLRNQFLENVGYDHFVASFLTAGGESSSGPAAFYASLDVEPKKLAGATSQIFLGQQLKCAECHDHPFDRWTQKDFWAYTAFFGQLERKQQGQTVYIADTGKGEVTLPESDEIVEPAYPGGDLPEWDPDNNRRRQLTIWMASRDNPYLARAIVNRVWAHLFGRGQIEPIDAMDQQNAAVTPEMFDQLVEHFTENRFNLRRLFRIIMHSKAYRLSSRCDQPPEAFFHVMHPKTLSPEQFYDSLVQNVIRSFESSPQMGIVRNNPARDQFLQRMRSAGSTVREYPHGVIQALGIMNGPEVSRSVNLRSSGLLKSLEAPFFDDNQKVETLFLATVSRFPTARERERFSQHLASTDQKSAALSDMLWALLNSSEYATTP